MISIVEFVDRYRLGPTFRLLHAHQVRDPVGKVVGSRDRDKIGRTQAPVLNQLPPRKPADGGAARDGRGKRRRGESVLTV